LVWPRPQLQEGILENSFSVKLTSNGFLIVSNFLTSGVIWTIESWLNEEIAAMQYSILPYL